MKLCDFDYLLPKELIAQAPVPVRDQSRLMVVDRESGCIRHDSFSNLPNYLAGHPLMVFNDTRVVPAKLLGQRKNGGKPVEVLLVREGRQGLWEALVKGLGRLKVGSELVFGKEELTAVLVEKQEGRGIFRFSCSGDLQSILARVGRIPLPPYIHRGDNLNMDKQDRERYQTVYAHNRGAIAAPTAGLHFTGSLLQNIRLNYADVVFLTLHVGVGTFQPIRAENITRHKMEEEYFSIPKDTWNQLVDGKIKGRKVLAVGTTTTRVLESADFSFPRDSDVSGRTDRFIYPGYKFKTVGQLLTNFHLPKSTLYLLVCAFAGKELMEKAYQTAIREKYRFFSYGDAMLIL